MNINTNELIEIYPENGSLDFASLAESIKLNIPLSNFRKPELDKKNREMDKLLCQLLLCQLQSIGMKKIRKSSINDLAKELGIIESYQEWFKESIRALIQNLTQEFSESELFHTPIKLNLDIIWEEWNFEKNKWNQSTDTKAQITLIETTLKSLPNILLGKKKATDIIFPNSSMELVEGIYKDNNTVDFFNEIVSLSILNSIKELLKKDPKAEIRIIEIGAGTGGTSTKVFKMLNEHSINIKEYCYTDISQAFLIHAKKEFAPQNSSLSYKIFNVEQSPTQQNIEIGQYDIAIATNVLHATKNIKQAIRNTKACLKNNGILILNEISEKSLFTHLTFGLLEGWWMYEDPTIRIPGCPGLYSKTWQQVLEEEGFKSVFFPVNEMHFLGQQVILSQSDGIVRQKTLPKDINKVKKTLDKGLTKEVFHKPTLGEKSILNLSTLKEKSKEYFKKLIGDGLKIPHHRIDASEDLEKYGIDSIIVVQFADELNKFFEDVNSSIFFEYPTINDLVEFFVKKDRMALENLLGIAPIPPIKMDNDKNTSNNKPVVQKITSKRFYDTTKIQGERVSSKSSDIAIIGMTGRYPKAKNLDEFWENLAQGKDCITEIPAERWDHKSYYDKDKNVQDKTYSIWGGFLEDVEKFDPLFFNISPREAELLDPQERLFLENVWDLFENSGYTRTKLQSQYESQVGVFVGTMYQHYRNFGVGKIQEPVLSLASYGSIANRTSYFFDLQGPSIAIDTMCSSSLIALHMACESLLKEECKIAIAGGVNLSIHPYKYIGLSRLQVIGSHKNCRSFSDSDGYLPAEAIGSVLLKPLSEAIKDKDEIMAVIKSSAINHDGKSNGFSAPNPNAQVRLVKENFNKSRINPNTIGYIEAAANGSPLGDAIEFNALKRVFTDTERGQPYPIGSVKSNIGHAEAASGISQLTKVILQLKHKKLVPSIKSKPLNPQLNLKGTPFQIQEELTDWKQMVRKKDGKTYKLPRRATVSSFGIGGSNAHVILEEYENPVLVENSNYNSKEILLLIVFSAKTKDQRKEVAKQLLEFVEKKKKLSLLQFAYTLQVGKESMEHRCAMIIANRNQLIDGLKTVIKSKHEEDLIKSSIQIYLGSPMESVNLNNLLSGSLGETIAKVLLAENNLEKLASYWVQGGKISWKSLYKDRDIQLINLPTYPFLRKRYWIENELPPPIFNDIKTSKSEGKIDNKKPNSKINTIRNIVANMVGVLPSEVDMNLPLANYGFDSLISTNLVSKLQKEVEPTIEINDLQKWVTTQDIINSLAKDDYIDHKEEETVSIQSALKLFPELIHLNDKTEGKPIFWFHPALGGVSIYNKIAEKSERPFFGIQAKGWGNDRLPLRGMQNMAAYYIKIMMTIQPEGPYDLGGYSMGGVLAYEVTTQLQLLGKKVGSIVMLDSLYLQGLKRLQTDMRTVILRTINLALLKTIIDQPEKFSKLLIHRSEVETIKDEESFLDELVSIAKKRGMKNTKSQIKLIIKHNSKVQLAFEVDKHEVRPLPDPKSLTCYYFRNKNGLFYGELEPYCSIEKPSFSIDHTTYWKEWEKQIPNTHIMDVDSSCHMTMFSEKKVYQTIFRFCKKLYSKEGMNKRYLRTFKNDIIKKHGYKNPVIDEVNIVTPK
ncbi:beta-ketoacyl synthase N-terminal-like domain-containing protein [Flavivirga jejuensis]|uniref:Beta-ketoacyl synthase N-terminal-like domain-containing protein n=1 Tax=Flavivirga jejuensis TaxID=870487 RepID=A0ABT8WU34_9FLAO|nr:beta-ketoacyl synthase N-terminal-like domain-containing protein [Flavivirga jejuensis]MDO5976693.1 beta-ketoacyl synthase N-terminal-like domain-containing protein [Flavivirga jejuensis]